MTPEQLAVERDALLQGGRTLEEVEAMQRAHALRVALEDALELLSHADFRNGNEHAGVDEGAVLAGRSIARLRAVLSPPETRTGASAPRPQGGTP